MRTLAFFSELSQRYELNLPALLSFSWSGICHALHPSKSVLLRFLLLRSCPVLYRANWTHWCGGKKRQISSSPSVGRISVSAPSWTGSPRGQVPGWPEWGCGRRRVSAWRGGWQSCSISCFLTSSETGCTAVRTLFLCVSSGKCPSGSSLNHSTCQCTFRLSLSSDSTPFRLIL